MRKLLFLTTLALGLAWFSTPVFAVDKQLKVVTTFTVIADIARNVAGEAAIVESITKPGAEIHDYQPTPKDIVRTQNADIILWNGLNLERWFEKFMQDIQDVPHITVSDGITPLSIYAGPYFGKPNPHAWMSTHNALIYIDNIKNALSQNDPKNAKIYAQNATRYKAEVQALRQTLEKTLSLIPEDKRTLVTSEGAFSYLAQDLKMQELYLWPINADRQGTPKQVKHVIDQVRLKKIPVIFSESTISDKPAKQVAKETGALFGGVLYVDSLSTLDGPVPTYLDLLRVTTTTIASGFTQALKNTEEKAD